MPDPWNKRFDVSHALSVLGEEIQSLHPRFQVTDVLARALPPLSFQRVRTALYRASGISIGPRSLIAGRLELIGPGDITSRLTIGSDCWLNSPIFADLTSDITIGNGVTLGHHVVIVTADHAIGPKERRAGPVVPAPVVIEDGAWIGAGVTVLPGARVGTGSVVGAGSLVVGTLPPGVLALGRPARAVRPIEPGEILAEGLPISGPAEPARPAEAPKTKARTRPEAA